MDNYQQYWICKRVYSNKWIEIAFVWTKKNCHNLRIFFILKEKAVISKLCWNNEKIIEAHVL